MAEQDPAVMLNAMAQQRNAALDAVVQNAAVIAALQQENAGLKARITELEGRLSPKVIAALQQENAGLKARITEFEGRLSPINQVNE